MTRHSGSRDPDSNGWYNHALSVSFAGTDATSGLDSCVPPQDYSGPDSPNASVSGSCVDHAGNTSVVAFGLSYDSTAPHAYGVSGARPGLERLVQPTAAGRVRAARTPPRGSTPAPPRGLLGPGRRGRFAHRRVQRPGGEHERRSRRSRSRYDASAPQVAADSRPGARRERLVQPSAHGRLQRRGRHIGHRELRPRDLLGPGRRHGVRRRLLPRPGRQRGQLRASSSSTTRPRPRSRSSLRRPASAAPSSSGERRPTRRRCSSCAHRAERRDESVVFQRRGLGDELPRQRSPRRAHVPLPTAGSRRGCQRGDAARSSSWRRGALLYPGPGERVSKPPLLVWSAAPRATYYNVVLVRGRRVFSAWPVRARLQLPRSWKYHGRRYKLRPGTYRWYVWPGTRSSSPRGGTASCSARSSFVVSR